MESANVFYCENKDYDNISDEDLIEIIKSGDKGAFDYLINKYKEAEDETIKKEIYNNEKFMRYKRLENETNLLIMKLNKIFKEIGERDENN